MPSFLITGATGQQGGGVARALLAQGHSVHALVRNLESSNALALKEKGAKLFRGSFQDIESLKAASVGVSGVFLNTYPGVDSGDSNRSPELVQADNILVAAKEAGTVMTIVVSTAFFTGRHPEWAAEDPTYVLSSYYGSKYAIEEAVKTSGFPYYTILRPAWLFHNYLPPHVRHHFPELIPERVLATASQPESKMAHFDAEDVGKFAAAALTRPEEWNGKELELGYESFTSSEAADILSKELDTNIEVRYRDAVEIEEMKTKVATQPFMLWANQHDFTIDGIEKYGFKLTTFEEYLKQVKAQFESAFAGVSR